MTRRRTSRGHHRADNSLFYLFLVLTAIFIGPSILSDLTVINPLPKVLPSAAGANLITQASTITIPINWDIRKGDSRVKTSLSPLSVLTGSESFTTVTATATLDYQAQGTVTDSTISNNMQVLFDGVVKKSIPFSLPSNYSPPVTIGTMTVQASEIEAWTGSNYGTHIITFSIPSGGTFTMGFTNGAHVTVGIEGSQKSMEVIVSGQYTLTVNIVGQGTVARSPDQATYPAGSQVVVTATAAPGWVFSGWSGDRNGPANPAWVTMTSDKETTATFTQGSSTGYVESCNTFPNAVWTNYGTGPVVENGAWVFRRLAGDRGLHEAITTNKNFGYGAYTIKFKVNYKRQQPTDPFGFDYCQFLIGKPISSYAESKNELDMPEIYNNKFTFSLHRWEQDNKSQNANSHVGIVIEPPAGLDPEDGNWHTWKTVYTPSEIHLYLDNIECTLNISGIQQRSGGSWTTFKSPGTQKWLTENPSAPYFPLPPMEMEVGSGVKVAPDRELLYIVDEITYNPS